MTSVANDPRGPEGSAQRLPEEVASRHAETDDGRSSDVHLDVDGTTKDGRIVPMPDLAPMTQETAPDTDVSLEPEAPREVVFDVDEVAVSYSGTTAVEGISLEIEARQITAFIGPSGCGKSTFIRCLNRMNDLVLGAEVHGSINYHGVDLYGSGVDPVEVRRRIGMVFQKPNPFPKSIYDNIAFGPRVNGMRSGLDDIVEHALRRPRSGTR